GPVGAIGRSRFECGEAADVALRANEKTVADERRLAGAGDACNCDELPERDVDVDTFEVVLARAANANRASRQSLSRRERVAEGRVRGLVRRRARRSDIQNVAAELARTGPDLARLIGA